MTAKTLLVEDSRYLRTACRRVLTEAGFGVVEASDGEEKLYGGFGRTSPTSSFWTSCCPGWEANTCSKFFSKRTACLPGSCLAVSLKNAGKLKKAGASAYIEKSKLDLTGGGENLVRVVNAALREARPQVQLSHFCQPGSLAEREKWVPRCGPVRPGPDGQPPLGLPPFVSKSRAHN